MNDTEVASGPGRAPTRPRPVRGQEDGFRIHDLDHESTANLPSLPGVIRVEGAEDNTVVLVSNIRAWVQSHRAELHESGPRGQRRLLWDTPGQADLETLYRRCRGALGALREGRPTALDDLREAPKGWGLYRFTKPSGEVYVGISSNVRARLQAHRHSGRLDPDVDTVEVLAARQPGTRGVVTWADLQEAERFHIRKLRNRGVTLVNIVGGGNGMPPGRRFNLPTADGVGLDSAIEDLPPLGWSKGTLYTYYGDETSVRDVAEVQLQVDYLRVSGQWRLALAVDGELQLWGMPPSRLTRRHKEVETGMISGQLLRRLYRSQRGRDLDADLAALPRPAGLRALATVADLAVVPDPMRLPDQLTIRYWRPEAGLLDDRQRARTPAQALLTVTAWHVRTRTLPDELVAAGIEIDPGYQRRAGLNEVVRLRSETGAHIYLKVEENGAAATAELLASLLWYRMGWPGVGERVLLSTDRSVLIVPPVGYIGEITDLGNFNSVFKAYPFERDAVTFDAERAGVIRAVPLHALSLEDPDDVLRFVAMNAAWGNSDRHAENVHYGWRRDPEAPEGGYGYLLPLDHGRCFFNNDPGRAGEHIHGSPAAAVTGRISNPHQLLRAFADRAAADPAGAAAVVVDWASGVATVLDELLLDSEWWPYLAELTEMRGRLYALADDPDRFIGSCGQVVLR